MGHAGVAIPEPGYVVPLIPSTVGPSQCRVSKPRKKRGHLMSLFDKLNDEKWLLIFATAVPIGLVIIIVLITQLAT